MASYATMENIKKYIQNSVGNNYDIVAKHGRKKILIENCILDCAYPSIFTVKTKDARSGALSILSFSYIDILTKNVCIFPPFSIKKEKGA